MILSDSIEEGIELLESALILAKNGYSKGHLANAYFNLDRTSEKAEMLYKEIIEDKEIGWEAQEFYIISYIRLAEIYESRGQTEESISFTEIVDDDGTTTASYKWAKAKIRLEVTPQVTNEGSIVMKVVLAKDSFGEWPSAEAPPNITTRKVTTNVLVENGSTIVIGGMYSYSTEETHAGIPFLKDLPIVGWLFRTFYNPNFNKKEMVIFITPRIINQEEAGLIDESVKI